MDKEIVVYVCTMKYSVIEKSEILPFMRTWMDFGIVLSEISQRQIMYDLTYMQNLKKKTKHKNLNTKLIVTEPLKPAHSYG